MVGDVNLFFNDFEYPKRAEVEVRVISQPAIVMPPPEPTPVLHIPRMSPPSQAKKTYNAKTKYHPSLTRH